MEIHVYIIMGLFAILSGVSGGLVGYYKSRSELQTLLKDYRTVLDCSSCTVSIKVENMEKSYTAVIQDIKDHTKAVNKICTELQLLVQMQDVIGKSHEGIIKQLDGIYKQQQILLAERKQPQNNVL